VLRSTDREFEPQRGAVHQAVISCRESIGVFRLKGIARDLQSDVSYEITFGDTEEQLRQTHAHAGWERG